MELSRRLRAARALSGKEVREIAPEVGLSERAYYRLEQAVRVPTALELWRIARATDQPIEFFFASLAAEDGPGTVIPSAEEIKASAPSQRKRGRAIAKRIAEGAR